MFLLAFNKKMLKIVKRNVNFHFGTDIEYI